MCFPPLPTRRRQRLFCLFPFKFLFSESVGLVVVFRFVTDLIISRRWRTTYLVTFVFELPIVGTQKCAPQTVSSTAGSSPLRLYLMKHTTVS
jgi:hypothetical protein